MGAGKGKTRRAQALPAQTRLGQSIQKRERARKGTAQPQMASVSSGSHGEAYAEGTLTLSEQGEILVAGHKSPLDNAVFNAQLRDQEVDLTVRVIKDAKTLLFQPELRLRGKIEDRDGIWHVGGRPLKGYLELFIGKRVEFEVSLANRLFAEEVDDPSEFTVRPVSF